MELTRTDPGCEIGKIEQRCRRSHRAALEYCSGSSRISDNTVLEGVECGDSLPAERIRHDIHRQTTVDGRGDFGPYPSGGASVTIASMDDQQREPTRPEWVNEAEEALERAADAIRSAWDQTRDSRMTALDSAKQAAKQLGEAIDRGVETARRSWQGDEGTQPSAGDEAAPNQQSGAGEEE